MTGHVVLYSEDVCIKDPIRKPIPTRSGSLFNSLFGLIVCSVFDSLVTCSTDLILLFLGLCILYTQIVSKLGILMSQISRVRVAHRYQKVIHNVALKMQVVYLRL